MRPMMPLMAAVMGACSDYELSPQTDPTQGPDTGAVLHDDDSGAGGEDSGAPPSPPPDCTNTAWTTTEVTLSFPARQDCPWGEGDNDAARDGFTTARVTESFSVDMPAFADLCAISISSTTEDLLFDDHVTLTLGDWILMGGASGYDISLFEEVDGLYRYDWSRLRGAAFNPDRKAPTYCLGGADSVCEVPHTEQQGPLSLDFSSTVMAPLMAAFADAHALPFALHTFGDNDAGDCAHTDMVLTVTVQSVLE